MGSNQLGECTMLIQDNVIILKACIKVVASESTA